MKKLFISENLLHGLLTIRKREMKDKNYETENHRQFMKITSLDRAGGIIGSDSYSSELKTKMSSVSICSRLHAWSFRYFTKFPFRRCKLKCEMALIYMKIQFEMGYNISMQRYYFTWPQDLGFSFPRKIISLKL